MKVKNEIEQTFFIGPYTSNSFRRRDSDVSELIRATNSVLYGSFVAY